MKKTPNIILFNPDQFRADALGHLGNKSSYTPNFDNFAYNEAVSFSNTFVQNPVCTPSRSSFMTGLYPHTKGNRTMHHLLNPECGDRSVLEVLKENNYFLWWGGKNDLINPLSSFMNKIDVRYSYEEDAKKRTYKMQKNTHHLYNQVRAGEDKYSFYLGKLSTNDDIYYDNDWAMVLGAVDYIDNYDGSQPFFLYLPISYPHPPYGVEEPYFSLIKRGDFPRIKEWEDHLKPSILAEIRKNQGLENFTEDKWQEIKAVYHGMCARVDAQFKLIIEALQRKNLYDDSAIFVFSDHGDFTGDYNLVEKTQNTFEDCLTRVPFMFKAPKEYNILSGINNQLTELVDFSETVYDLLNLSEQEKGYRSFGKSLLPLLQNKIETLREYAFCEGGRNIEEWEASEWQTAEKNHEGNNPYLPRMKAQYTSSKETPYHTRAIMCRSLQFKYVKRAEEIDEFYDLTNDKNETINQINNPKYQEKINEFRMATFDWLVKTSDTVSFAGGSRG